MYTQHAGPPGLLPSAPSHFCTYRWLPTWRKPANLLPALAGTESTFSLTDSPYPANVSGNICRENHAPGSLGSTHSWTGGCAEMTADKESQEVVSGIPFLLGFQAPVVHQID